MDVIKLDSIGHVDNRPSTNQLHHYVKKNLGIHIFFN